jgi:alpha-ribazole phosphatase/probable phosphoglycerate mutase
VTRLVLARHTEPEKGAHGRCYGSLDVDLSAEGRSHADALGAALSSFGVHVLYSSPLRRALETAGHIGAHLRLEPRVHPDLRELDFGELEGRTYDEIAASEPALWRTWMETPTAVCFPGGESYADLRARVAGALEEIRAQDSGSVVALVAHGGVNRALLAPALGLRDDEIFVIPQNYGAVSVIDWLGDEAVVHSVNADLILAAS